MAILGSTDLGDGRRYLTVDHDPTVTSTDALSGSLIYSTSTSTLYEKLDSGDTTNVAVKDNPTDPRTDPDAIHDNVANEIDPLTEKVGPVATDLLLIEDSAAGGVKKKVQIGNLPTAAGGDDVSVNGAGASDANFSDTLPAPPAGNQNIKWQKDAAAPDNISGYLDEATEIVKGVTEVATQAEVNAGVSLRTHVSPGTLASAATVVKPGDAAGGDLGGTYPNPTVNDGADGTAIHDNVAGEINAITEKVAPVAADLLLIEDSAAANAKKKIQIGNLPGGGSAVETWRWVVNGKPQVSTLVDGAFIVPRAGTIISVTAFLRVRGASAGNLIVDVHKNGTTIFTTQGNRPTIPWSAGNNAIDRVTNMDVTAVAQNDRLQMDIDDTHDGNPLDVTVMIELEWT